MSDNEKPQLHAPVDVSIEVFIINPETGDTGIGTLTMGHLKYPTQDDLAEAVAEFEAGLEEQAPGYRLMTKDEAFNTVVTREFGPQVDEDGERISVASPGGKCWDSYKEPA